MRGLTFYALGLVLYEMASGKRAAQGQTPAVAALPEKVAHTIERCLQEDAECRWQTATDLKSELEWAARAPSTAGTARKGRKAWWIASLVTAVAVSIVAAALLRRSLPELPELRLEITTPPTNDPVSMAISPDGRTVVFAASLNGADRRPFELG